MIEFISLLTGIVALLSIAYYAFKFGYRLGVLELKVNFLWNIYIERLLDSVIRKGLAWYMSRVRLSEEGKKILGNELLYKIEILTKKYYKKFRKDEYTLIAKVIAELISDIRNVATRSGVEFDLVLGLAIAYIKEILGELTCGK